MVSNTGSVHDSFSDRHLGIHGDEPSRALKTIGVESVEALLDRTVPAGLPRAGDVGPGPARSEAQVLQQMRELAAKNTPMRSLIGQGYYNTVTPAVIRRTILENPGWYTHYTPYQAEIAQGRLEALLNYQTMVSELTGLPVTNASLLDEATAAAEAVTLCIRAARDDRSSVLCADNLHPQVRAVVGTRADFAGTAVHDCTVGELAQAVSAEHAAVLVGYPGTDGLIPDLPQIIAAAHAVGARVIVQTDLLALMLLQSPGAIGADLAIGSSQRFGVPMGYGGPHAAFIAAAEEHRRRMPGRIVGVSRDRDGRRALRLALQTREQHIRRSGATSNICTAQVLLAVMASMYAVYHGPERLRAMAQQSAASAERLATALRATGYTVRGEARFDTVVVQAGDRTESLLQAARDAGFNLRRFAVDSIGITTDETVTDSEVETLLQLFGADGPGKADGAARLPGWAVRHDPGLLHPIFRRYHSETEFERYVHRLERKDVSLLDSMIPLGSCTMKLNPAATLEPLSWPEFGSLHPYVPQDQAAGYAELASELSSWLGEITGLPAVSLQPNSGAQGEYAGLLAIRGLHRSRGDDDRRVCLIPSSAHGTNPASAVMAGMEVVVVDCDQEGSVDLQDLRQKISAAGPRLAALMVTYPSTHGVYEEEIAKVTGLVHEAGGLVYMDGANLNAQVGVIRAADLGADVCHINLHKTFSIPHGGGGPGMGPICATEVLRPFLPGDPLASEAGPVGPVSAARWGSASILTISYAYMALMGSGGLRAATAGAVLAANYIAARLSPHFHVVYRGPRGTVAHELIIDGRPFKEEAGVDAEDIAKRLMDYGYHAPTMSWPVAGTLMIEPTESESLAEMDRFCDAMISIRGEIRNIAEGRLPREDNPLINAPHTLAECTADDWAHPYSRATAAWPLAWVSERKVWPAVARIDNAYGDRHLVCTCPPMEDYASDAGRTEAADEV